MQIIASELDRMNPFLESFKSMNAFRSRHTSIREVSMCIKINRNLDWNSFNNDVTDEAFIFSANDGEPPFELNIIVFNRFDGTLRNLSVLDSTLDSLAYLMLFSNDDTG